MPTIRWFLVKCSFYDEPIGIQYWSDVVDFLTHNACFDYEIKGKTTKPFEGIKAKYTKENKIEKI